MEPENEEPKTYHLDNGVIVTCGPLRISYREEGDKMIMRCDMDVKTTIPGMVCSFPNGNDLEPYGT